MADNTTANAVPAPSTAPETSTDTSQESNDSGEVAEGTEPDAAPVLAAAPSAKEVKQELKKQMKKLKLKVDSKEEEIEFDPNDDEFLTRELQKAKAFQKRSQEYSTLEKNVRNFVEELRTNPRKILSDPNIGIDLKKLAAEVIEQEIANSQKSPEQLEKEHLEEELNRIRTERENEKKEMESREFERLQQHEMERYDIAMTKALQASDLPKTPYVVKKMADYMLIGLQEGMDVSPEDVIPLVRKEMQNDLKQMFAVLPDEVIESLVGKDVFTRIRKKSVNKAKSGQVAPPQPLNKAIKDVGGKATDDGKPQKKISFKEFFKV